MKSKTRQVRIKKELVDLVEEQAHKDQRSISKQMNVVLTRFFDLQHADEREPVGAGEGA